MAHPLRIIFVEDLPSDQELAEWQLHAEGLQFISIRVDTGGAFVQALADFQPDLIISDYSMPEFDGMQALKLAQEWNRDIPFIVLTGSMNEDVAVECMKAGASNYVIKENIQRLPFAVQDALKQQQVRKEKDQAEEQLRESESKFRSLFENNHAVMLLIDPATAMIIDANRAACLYYGWSTEEFANKRLSAINTLDENEINSQLHEAASEERSYFQFQHRLANGEVRDVEIYSGPIEHKGKTILYSIVHDVTARKVAEAALRENEDRYRNLIMNSPDAIFVDHQDRLILVNNACLKLFGAKSAGELLGKSVYDLFHPDYHKQIKNRIHHLRDLNESIPVHEEQIVRLDGSIVDVDVIAAPFSFGGSNDIHVILRDITTRKLAEQQLHLQSAALNSAANAILITDREGAIEWINPAYTQLTGYSFEEAIGQNPRILKSGVQHEEYYKNLWDTIMVGQMWRGELVNRRKDGSLYTEEETITPLMGANGQVEHFIGIKVDITERKQQEAEIIKNNQDINLLYQAGRQLSQNLDLQRIYLSFYTLISSTMKCDELYIAEFDSPKELISIKFAILEGTQVDVSGFPIVPLDPEGYGIQSPVIRSGKSRLINNYVEVLQQTKSVYFLDNSGKVVKKKDVAKDAPITQTSLVLPILMNNQVTGVVQIQSTEKDAYTPEDLKIAEALVAQIAVAANNAQLYQQSLNEIEARIQAEASLQIRVKRQEKMAALARELATTLDLETIYQTSERYLKGMIDCSNFGITLYDPKKQLISVAYLVTDDVPIDPGTLPSLQFTPQNSTIGRSKAIASKTPVIIHDLAAKRKATGSMLVGSAQEPETAIYVPILAADEVMGLLDLQSYTDGAYLEEDGEWLSVVATQIGLAIQNARLFTQTRQRVAELLVLYNIDQAITSSDDSARTYQRVLEQIATQPYVDAIDILIFDPQEKMLRYTAGHGFSSDIVLKTKLQLGEGLAGKVALERSPLQMLNPTADMPGFFRGPLWEQEGFAAYHALPLLFHGGLKGVIEIYSRNPIPAEPEWLNFMSLITQQVAIAVDNSQLFRGLQEANVDLIKAYDATIAGWSQAMDLRDKETEGHSERVLTLTMRLARAVGIDEEKLVHIRRGSLLHDMGKLGIPDSILHKPGPLTAEEWVVMKKHPLYAYEMLRGIDYLAPALAIPYCHHEKWNGTGYPRGLKGEEIPREARIFALVDAYDALTSDRPYRAAWSKERALAHIQRHSGKHFDPHITKVFLALLREQE